MLRIKKDNVEKIVPSGLYDDLYKGMGYEIVGGDKVAPKAAPEKVAASDETKPTPTTKPTFTKNDKKVEK